MKIPIENDKIYKGKYAREIEIESSRFNIDNNK